MCLLCAFSRGVAFCCAGFSSFPFCLSFGAGFCGVCVGLSPTAFGLRAARLQFDCLVEF